MNKKKKRLTPEKVLIRFFRESIKELEAARKRVREKYPKLFD